MRLALLTHLANGRSEVWKGLCLCQRWHAGGLQGCPVSTGLCPHPGLSTGRHLGRWFGCCTFRPPHLQLFEPFSGWSLLPFSKGNEFFLDAVSPAAIKSGGKQWLRVSSPFHLTPRGTVRSPSPLSFSSRIFSSQLLNLWLFQPDSLNYLLLNGLYFGQGQNCQYLNW